MATSGWLKNGAIFFSGSQAEPVSIAFSGAHEHSNLDAADTYFAVQDTPRDAVSGGRPGGRGRSQAHSHMSPVTDEENSNIMLLLDAAEELHKTGSQDAPEPSTAATHGIQSAVSTQLACVLLVLSVGAVNALVPLGNSRLIRSFDQSQRQHLSLTFKQSCNRPVAWLPLRLTGVGPQGKTNH